jgi:hypothetical protein
VTPLQFAAKWCANWDGGACSGVWLNDAGQVTHCKPLPKCVLPARCRYFEDCVAPNSNTLPGKDGAEAQEAWRTYRLGLALPISTAVKAQRKCGCGTVLLPRHRLCPKCQKAKRRASQATADTRRRSDANS